MKVDNTNNFGYQKKLQPVANTLRKNMTKAEACLWKFVLRAGNMKGFTFRRQRPVLNYIADFMCKELMLVIEVDGITHHHEEIFEKDKIKQKDLEDAGFKVIRFNDEEILEDIENVRREIEFNVEEIQRERNIPPPTPRQRGRFAAVPEFVTPTPASGGDLPPFLNSSPQPPPARDILAFRTVLKRIPNTDRKEAFGKFISLCNIREKDTP